MHLYATKTFFCIFPAKQIVHSFCFYEAAYFQKNYANAYNPECLCSRNIVKQNKFIIIRKNFKFHNINWFIIINK